MTFRLRASDGVETPILKSFLNQMSLFVKNPALADAGFYELRCKVSQKVLNAFVEKLYDDTACVEITEDNFEQLQSLCEEIGFWKLDGALQAFRNHSAHSVRLLEERANYFEVEIEKLNDTLGQIEVEVEHHVTTVHEFLDRDFKQLKRQIAKHETLFEQVQRQLGELVNENLLERVRLLEESRKQTEIEFRECMEKKLEDMATACASRKVEQALKECAKESDLEKLAQDVAQLKDNENGTAMKLLTETEQPVRSTLEKHFKEHQNDTTAVESTMEQRREFVYDDSNRLDGVIAGLTRDCGGNVDDNGIVHVTASSVYYNRGYSYHPKNAVDLGTKSDYWSENKQNSWICYDFKERRVIPTSYSVMSSGGYYLKSWVIDVSNDGTTWTEIDRRENNNDLNGKDVTANFKISHVPSESFRFFRLKQTGENHFGHSCYYLMLSSLEIFGTLLE